MRLPDVAKELAMMAQGTEDYSVSSYDAAKKTVTIADLGSRFGEHQNGCAWYRDEEGIPQMDIISRAGNQTLVLTDGFPAGYVPEYITVSHAAVFTARQIVQAINSVLTGYPIISSDETLISDGELEYDIPPGVTDDIRRVEIITNDSPSVSHYWKRLGNKLKVTAGAGAVIRIYYVAPHGVVTMNGNINDQVNRRYVVMMAYLSLWRNVVQITHKDNVIASEFFNEAKVYEANEANAHIPRRNLMKRDQTYANYG